MQINPRDYIEFQLEESSSSGAANDGKLDYLVSMAIEKNSQLLAQLTLQQRKIQRQPPQFHNPSFASDLEHLGKPTNLQESLVLPQYKGHQIDRQLKADEHRNSPFPVPILKNQPLHDHGLPLVKTEHYTTTTTFTDKRLKLAYESRLLYNRQDADRVGGGVGAAADREELRGSKTCLIATATYEKTRSRNFLAPYPLDLEISENNYYWHQRGNSHTNSQVYLDADHYRRRLLRLATGGVYDRNYIDSLQPKRVGSATALDAYGTFDNRQKMSMIDTNFYRRTRNCIEPESSCVDDQDMEREHAKLLHRMMMTTTTGRRTSALESNEELLSNYCNGTREYQQLEQQRQRDDEPGAYQYYFDTKPHQQSGTMNISSAEDRDQENWRKIGKAPLAGIDQDFRQQQQYEEQEWRQSGGSYQGPQLSGTNQSQNQTYGCGQINRMLPEATATGAMITQGKVADIGIGGEGGLRGNENGAMIMSSSALEAGSRIPEPGRLFNRSAHCTQIIAALAISLGPIAVGMAKGYSSPAIDSLQEPRNSSFSSSSFYVSDQSASWLASLSLLGALFGGMFGGLAMQFGRKRVLTIMSLPFSMFWLFTVFAKSVQTMFITAFFAGFCVSIIAMVTQVYVSEIASSDIRGFLSAIQKVAGHLGFLVSFSLGAYLDWRQLAMLVAVAPIMLFVTVIYIPETPSYLALKGRDEEALRALQFLRGPNSCVNLELETIRNNIRVMKRNSSATREGQEESAFRNPFALNNGLSVTGGARNCLFVVGNSIKSIGDSVRTALRNGRLIKPIMITCGLMVFQRFSGPNSFNFYAVKIFRQTFSGMNPHGGAVAVGFVQLLASMLSGLLIDTVGRIPLLIISTVFMSLAFACLGSYIYYEQGSKLAATNALDYEALSEASHNDWIPLLCVLIFMIAFSLGISPISSLLVGELFPLEYRAMGSSIATSFSFFCSFLSVKTFVDFQEKLGLHGVFWLYSGISCIGLIFVVTCVPETKGKDLDEMNPKLMQPMTINR